MHEYGRYGAGRSMFPTLQSGDKLKVVPYKRGSIRVGDVILFHPPGQDREVVHRVISVDSEGIKTRGDNNKGSDAWTLSPWNIVGRVVSAQRNTLLRKRLRLCDIRIYGGMPGRIVSGIVRTIKQTELAISRILHPVYRRLSQSDRFKNMLPQRFKTRILCFKRPNGTEMQLLMGCWVIGKRGPGWNEWRIRRPFRLFIDETTLPLGELGIKN